MGSMSSEIFLRFSLYLPTAKRSMFYAPVPVFWNEIEKSRFLRVLSPPFLA